MQFCSAPHFTIDGARVRLLVRPRNLAPNIFYNCVYCQRISTRFREGRLSILGASVEVVCWDRQCKSMLSIATGYISVRPPRCQPARSRSFPAVSRDRSHSGPRSAVWARYIAASAPPLIMTAGRQTPRGRVPSIWSLLREWGRAFTGNDPMSKTFVVRPSWGERIQFMLLGPRDLLLWLVCSRFRIFMWVFGWLPPWYIAWASRSRARLS